MANDLNNQSEQDPTIDQELEQLAGARDPQNDGLPIQQEELEERNDLTRTAIDNGYLDSTQRSDLVEGSDSYEDLALDELRDGETDNPYEASDEGLTYIPPLDPTPNFEPDTITDATRQEVIEQDYAAVTRDGSSAQFLPSDADIAEQVRSALRQDSLASRYADVIEIDALNGVVTLRGMVEDMIDADMLITLAENIDSVEDVIDLLDLRNE